MQATEEQLKDADEKIRAVLSQSYPSDDQLLFLSHAMALLGGIPPVEKALWPSAMWSFTAWVIGVKMKVGAIKKTAQQIEIDRLDKYREWQRKGSQRSLLVKFTGDHVERAKDLLRDPAVRPGLCKLAVEKGSFAMYGIGPYTPKTIALKLRNRQKPLKVWPYASTPEGVEVEIDREELLGLVLGEPGLLYQVLASAGDEWERVRQERMPYAGRGGTAAYMTPEARNEVRRAYEEANNIRVTRLPSVQASAGNIEAAVEAAASTEPMMRIDLPSDEELQARQLAIEQARQEAERIAAASAASAIAKARAEIAAEPVRAAPEPEPAKGLGLELD